MIGTILEANPFLGRIITGRIHSGSIKPNQAVKVLGQDGKVLESGRISKILAFRGIERQPIEEALRATSWRSPASPRAPSPTRSVIRPSTSR